MAAHSSRMRRFLAMILILIPNVGSAQPHLCLGPNMPTCLLDPDIWKEETLLRACHSEMERYPIKLFDFHVCLGMWKDQVAKRAEEEFARADELHDRAQAYWTCMATGKHPCQKP